MVLGPGPGEEPTSDRAGPLGGWWGVERMQANFLSAAQAAQLLSTEHRRPRGASLPGLQLFGIWGFIFPLPVSRSRSLDLRAP